MHLSRRERETLEWLIRGKSTKEIMHHFEIERSTIDKRVRAMRKKLGLPNRNALIAWGAVNRRILSADTSL